MSFKYSNTNVIFGILILLGILLNACKNETSTTTSGGDSVYEKNIPSKISVTKKDGKLFFSKTESKFDILELAGKDSAKVLLSIEQSESRQLSQDANTAKQFKISCKSLEGTKIDWTKDIEAADIDYSLKVVNAHYPTTGEQEDTYTYFDIKNGEKIMDFTYGELKAIIPNTSEKRFFTYLSKNNSLKDAVEGDGVVQFASSSKLLQRIAIKAKGAVKVPTYTPEMQVLTMRESGNQLAPDGKVIILMKLNESFTSKDVTGFAFQVSYYKEGEQEPYTIVFPVDNDKINLEQAIYDKAIFELKLID